MGIWIKSVLVKIRFFAIQWFFDGNSIVDDCGLGEFEMVE